MIDAPIGIFDSGLGGLTVWSVLKKNFPYESFVYIGDNARAPYGQKSYTELLTYNQEIINQLHQFNVKAIVVACNTSCATVLPTLASQIHVPYVDLISSAAAEASQKSTSIAVLATPVTAASGAYKAAIQAHAPQCHVVEIGCPDLVPLVEGGKLLCAETRAAVSRYIIAVHDQHLKTIVWGCSHYPFFQPLFETYSPYTFSYIDPAQSLINTIKTQWHALLQSQPPLLPPSHTFYVSGSPSGFESYVNQHGFSDVTIHGWNTAA